MSRGYKNRNTGYLLIGRAHIAEALGISPSCLSLWIKNEGFPASKLPNGSWSTTFGLIDAWVLARNKEQFAEDPNK